MDAWVRPDIGIAALYSVVVALSSPFARGRNILLIALGCIALTALDLVIHSGADASGRTAEQRLVACGAIAIATLLVLIQQRTQARLASVEHDFRTKLDIIPTHIWSASPDGTTDFVNQRRYDFTGPLSHWEQIVHPDDHAAHAAKWQAGIASRSSFESEVRLRRRDGTYRWFLVRAAPHCGRDGTILKWFGTNIDIDDLKRARQAEDALQRAQAELAHVTRVATLGELAASITHEVNQPLAAIVTNGEACLRWLRRTVPDLEEAQLAVERIVGDGLRAAEVVRRLRSLVQKGTTQRLPLNLNDVVRESLPLIGRELSNQLVTLELKLHDGLPGVLGDRVQLQQVIINLVVNSIQAMTAASDRPRVLGIHSAMEAGDHVVLAVRDTGPGIDSAIADRLFTPFFTTKPDGMGMGLSISRSIIEAHGGRIWAAPDDDTGAVFRLALPAYREQL